MQGYAILRSVPGTENGFAQFGGRYGKHGSGRNSGLHRIWDDACHCCGDGGEQSWKALVLSCMALYQCILVYPQHLDSAVCPGTAVCVQFRYGDCRICEVETIGEGENPGGFGRREL